MYYYTLTINLKAYKDVLSKFEIKELSMFVYFFRI